MTETAGTPPVGGAGSASGAGGDEPDPYVDAEASRLLRESGARILILGLSGTATGRVKGSGFVVKSAAGPEDALVIVAGLRELAAHLQEMANRMETSALALKKKLD